MERPIAGGVRGWLAGMRFPWLAGIAVAVFLIDLVVPDALPFVDEIVLGAVAAGLVAWKKKRQRLGPG